MTIAFGNVPAGSILPIFFASYGKTNGESITLTGLAVTDIEIYKGVSMTQRSSDAGYTLLDTDGIDVDSTTGIHAFSIDTSDNTDSGFFAAGSFYTVIVSAVTVDSQTVNFVAATFRLTVAEAAAGVPKVDVDTIKTQTVTCAAGVTVLASVGTAATSTAQTGDSFARLGAPSGASVSADIANNNTGIGLVKAKTDLLPASPAATGDAMTLTAAYDFAKGTVAMTESYAADGAAMTPVQALHMLWSFAAEKNVSSTTVTTKRLDGSTTSMTFTIDSASAPTSITRAT